MVEKEQNEKNLHRKTERASEKKKTKKKREKNDRKGDKNRKVRVNIRGIKEKK